MGSSIPSIGQDSTRIDQYVNAYHQRIKDDPERSQKIEFFLVMAVSIISAIGLGFAIKKKSLTVGAFAPLTLAYIQSGVLACYLDQNPKTQVDEGIAKDRERMIRYTLIALIAIGGGTAAAFFYNKLPKFGMLFSLFAANTGIALWHHQGVRIHSVETESVNS